MTDRDQDTAATDDGLGELLLPRKLSVMARLRNYFLTGLIVAAPIGLTVYIVSWFVDLIDRWFVPLVPEQLQPDHYLPFDIPGLGLIIALVLLTALGALTANFFGQAILRFAERVVERMPIVRGIYGALKQIFETVLSQSAPSFRQVALIEYPRKGSYSLGFITAPARGEIADVMGQEMIGVYVPTTPNPTSGFLLYLPREEVKVLDMTVEDGLKMIISLGIVEPKRK
ncbi:MAG TPA: DUF502 domain-containing protein [Parvibaculum sp.]